MNAIFYINNEPIILLSEPTVNTLYEKITKLIKSNSIDIDSINRILFWLNKLTYSPESFPIDIDEYFNKENIHDLETFIHLYSTAVEEIETEQDFPEYQVALSFKNELNNYLNELKRH